MAHVPFTVDSIPSLEGKTVLVTGANSGLGLESARALAAKGAHVLMAVRNLDKGQKALEEIRAEQPLASLQLVALDLGSLSSVRSCAAQLLASQQRLDALLNNAGIMAIPYTRTPDGFEAQFGTNHLGHFALTGLLFPLLLKSPGARVVNVSSQAHQIGRMRFSDLDWSQGYSRWGAYGMSKLANLLFTYELARRIAQKQLPVLAAAAHPGYAATNLQHRGAELAGHSLWSKTIQLLNPIGGQSAAMGALPQLYAATAPDVEPGDYVGPGGFMRARGYPKKMRSNARSYDAEAMRQLWEVSEQLTAVRYSAL
jgi:NAD(P)-dependent dehydrogenase (short-subunit alcohol dehydrogenase family)